ncbi:MAG: nucleotidyltransferase family protein [Candidatus Latescibacterota bacterium]|nr:nucleotidyltransferase family protein [Candidatus Latescibacterota bacterium]
MVLAAGRGTRLRPLTDSTPKPMIPFAGKPLLEYIVRLLAQHGFDEMVINLYHLPEVIQDYFGDGGDWSVSITYSLEKDLLGTAGAVRKVADFFDGPFLVYYGDNLTNFDLGEFWQAHRRGGEIASIGLLWMDDPTSRGIIGLDARNRIERFVEKPKPEQVFDDYQINAGTYVMEPEILERIPPGSNCDFSRDIFGDLLAEGRPLLGHRMRGQLLSTDTPERYQYACECVDSGSFILP